MINTPQTPMMKQYFEIKEQYKDYLLFYRLGDFYELFYSDAITAAPILGVVLTRKSQASAEEIPMCGVPYHACFPYISKLINHGLKVAICEQLETPEEAKKRGYKAVVKRDVVRIITPGTVLEESLLESKESNYLASISCVNNAFSISFIDITTAEFKVISVDANSVLDELVKLDPTEIIVSQKSSCLEQIKPCLNYFANKINILADSYFDYFKTNHKLLYHFNISNNQDLLKDFIPTEISACGSLLEYLYVTQKSLLPRLNLPKRLNINNFMHIDAKTILNLEILKSNNNNQNTLINFLDNTKTNAGSRLLKEFLRQPLIDSKKINNRLDTVEYFLQNSEVSEFFKTRLETFPDIERILARVSANKTNPKELLELLRGIKLINEIQYFTEQLNVDNELFNYIRNIDSQIYSLINLIENGIKENPPLSLKEGGYIKEGFDPTCDKYLSLLNDSQSILDKLRDNYRNITGVNSLKIGYNENMGFFIEVTPQHSAKLDGNEIFERKQTLVSCSRFTSEELLVLEKEILQARERLIAKELELFNEICSKVNLLAFSLAKAVFIISYIDILVSFAENAKNYNFNKPNVDNSNIFYIKNGRHPVIEKNLKKLSKQEFKANNTHFNEENKIALITGPNMAGKSTYLRQNALIAVLAQIGSFVPAEEAHLGITDAIFARIGASDDLANNQSTFMVEMAETANIINKATNKSLIIIDELGRGTSTYDGMAIAASTLEFIHNKIQAKCLFSTHYHELFKISSNLPKLKNYTMEIIENDGEIIFLHKVIEGYADKSYGIYVAKIAGLPKPLIEKATYYLKLFENQEKNNIIIDNQEVVDELREYIKIMNVDDLSPKQALDNIYKIKELA